MLVVLSLGASLNAQDSKLQDLKDFKIIIENTANGLNMQGVEGTVWTELSFTTNNNQPQAVNTYGMTTASETMEAVDDKYTRFLFTITKTGSGIELKGLEGTAWKELSITFSFKSEKVMLDQYGIKNIY
jgi:hypothetical protein